MTRDELIEKLNGFEWNDVEFKEAARDVPKDAWSTVSAFSNTAGGSLVFGVRYNNGVHEIVGVIDVDKVQNDFLSAIRGGQKLNRAIPVQESYIKEGDATLLIFHIPEARRQEKPVYLHGDIKQTFVRRGAGDERCRSEEIECFLRDASDERHDSGMVETDVESFFHAESLAWYCLMTMALEKRRLDIVKLLVEHGYDPTSIDARRVLSTWDPEIMEYFIESGCNLEIGNPLAWALCNRIRTSLPLFKKYQDRFPSIRKQVNVALRHHCRKGDAKWVSLLLWAGADPLCRGEDDPEQESDDEGGGISALSFAALYNHYELFELKAVKACLGSPAAAQIIDYLDGPGAGPVLASLLKRGLDPNNNQRGGSTAIQRCLEQFHYYGSSSRYSFDYFSASGSKTKLDSDRSREFMKNIYLLAEAGGKWRPAVDEIKSARNSLTKMIPEYTVEFISLMARFKAAKKEDVVELLRTPTIKSLVGKYRDRIDKHLESLTVHESTGP